MTPDFFFSVYDDHALVERLIRDLRQIYPQARLICIADGVDNPEFADFAQRHQVIYTVGERMKQARTFGGLWLERLFRFALEHSDSQHFIRTEGDAKFWRQFHAFPDADCAGTLSPRCDWLFPRGPCWYLRRSTIETILESGVLKQDIYKYDSWFSYGRYSRFLYPGEAYDPTPILLEDVMLGHILQRLNLSLSNWDEVQIEFRDAPPDNADLKFAVTHPHR